jgi:molecular chaperone HtpG
MKKENFEFQSEVKQLLDILVHSLYKEKEIFLRELISNSIDALNKIKFKSLTQEDVQDNNLELKIDISFNKEHKKLIIEDTGIGMTKSEIIKNIGTIAHSGATEFLKKLSKSEKNQNMDLIGQFGVGFYSSFIVAKEIHLYTKSYRKNSQGNLWISRGDNSYTVEKAVKKYRGTRIELLLRDDADEFLEQSRIENIISKHSKFLPFNIYVEKKKIETNPAIWTQPKSSLKEKDYNDFFKSIDFAASEPETYLHLSSDAPVQFNSILFVPQTSFESMGFMKEKPGVDLYSKKVLIQKGSEDIFPEYLRFVKGVIDSEEIPLNISRETVQNNIKIRKIKKYLLKKFFSHLENLKKKNPEKYLKIWNNFNKNFKEGIIQDFEYKDKLSELLLFNSSKSTDKNMDLSDYVKRMEKDQKEIYYVSGNDIDTVKSNPALEVFLKKDIEVLYLTNPIDEFVLENLREYKEKIFKAIEAADVKADKDEKKDRETIKKANNLITYLKTTYKDRVEDVKISQRLFDSPCMLSHPKNSPSIQMEKIMKMSNKDFKYSKRILEINPEHELIREMTDMQESNAGSEKLKTIALQMLDNMFLREGILDNIDAVIPRIQQIMLEALKNK